MVSFRPCRADTPPADALVAAMLAEMARSYGPIDGDDAPTASAGEMAPPGGAFVVGWEDGQAVAGGGVKRLDGQTAEIERMYVVPEARGRGVARALLGALELAARKLGYARVRLDTGPTRVQPHARALYESAGYAEIDDDHDNPHAAFWGEKRL
jgi:GNAT superfamily N-acetyltransferase